MGNLFEPNSEKETYLCYYISKKMTVDKENKRRPEK